MHSGEKTRTDSHVDRRGRRPLRERDHRAADEDDGAPRDGVHPRRILDANGHALDRRDEGAEELEGADDDGGHVLHRDDPRHVPRPVAHHGDEELRVQPARRGVEPAEVPRRLVEGHLDGRRVIHEEGEDRAVDGELRHHERVVDGRLDPQPRRLGDEDVEARADPRDDGGGVAERRDRHGGGGGLLVARAEDHPQRAEQHAEDVRRGHGADAADGVEREAAEHHPHRRGGLEDGGVREGGVEQRVVERAPVDEEREAAVEDQLHVARLEVGEGAQAVARVGEDDRDEEEEERGAPAAPRGDEEEVLAVRLVAGVLELGGGAAGLRADERQHEQRPADERHAALHRHLDGRRREGELGGGAGDAVVRRGGARGVPAVRLGGAELIDRLQLERVDAGGKPEGGHAEERVRRLEVGDGEAELLVQRRAALDVVGARRHAEEVAGVPHVDGVGERDGEGVVV
mmetsp:Transcript_35674/g.81654  ORF Transcript_35674/g.81654 Transcript_35674/m.81654 type:complete len:459 (-) Transcript_35674:837-2213(-)